MSGEQPFFSIEGVTQSNRFLHTPSAAARNNLLYVQEVGTLKSIMPHVCRRENLNSFLIMFVLNGRGQVKTKNQNCNVKAGDCVFLSCMNLYEHLSSEDEPWELMWVHFNGNSAGMYFDIFTEKNACNSVFRPKNSQSIEEYIRNLISLNDEKDIVSELKAASLLTGLLTTCISDVTDDIVLEDVREFINANYTEENIISLICEKYRYSEKQANELFYKNFGIELRDYILVRRFTAAKELLRFTIKDIPIIIEESGIRNEDLFRQLFRENEGITAEEYRMKWAQWIKS